MNDNTTKHITLTPYQLLTPHGLVYDCMYGRTVILGLGNGTKSLSKPLLTYKQHKKVSNMLLKLSFARMPPL